MILLTFANESDREKFEWLYHTYKNLMLAKARGILKDTMLAEDAVSEAFLRIYKNLDKIDDPSSNRSAAFVMVIVKNVSLTLLKKQQHAAVDLIEETQPDQFDLEEHMLSMLSSQQIAHALDDIGDDLKHVFLLKFGYDLSHKQIGELLHISENNVTVRLHRAKKKLAAILVKEGFVHD